MSGSPTILSAGGATKPSSGYWIAQGLSQVQALLVAAATVIPNDAAPTVLALPASQLDVVLGQGTNAAVTGGGAGTAVASAGVLDYSGAAGLGSGWYRTHHHHRRLAQW